MEEQTEPGGAECVLTDVDDHIWSAPLSCLWVGVSADGGGGGANVTPFTPHVSPQPRRALVTLHMVAESR